MNNRSPYFIALILIISLLHLWVPSNGQNTGQPVQHIDTLFGTGIRLNDSTRIPWGTKFTELINYGTPKITGTKKNPRLAATWDSAEIIPGVKAKLFTNKINAGHRTLDSLNNWVRPETGIFYLATLDIGNFRKLKTILITRFGLPKRTRPKRFHMYTWRIPSIKITVSKERPNRSYLTIVKDGM